VDNLTHTLCGAALAKTRLGRASRLAPLSLVVGANLADVDVLSRVFAGKEAYLVHHRGITHSLVGVVVGALLLAASVRWIERRTRPAGEAAVPWRAHLLPAFVGLASHPLLDLLNNYGVRPWLPFSSARYFGDLVFIVDPWLWLLFGGIAALAGARTRLGHLFWVAVAAFSCWLAFTSDRTPNHVKNVWPFALALVAALRALQVGRERPRRVVVAGAALLVIYLGGLELSARLAWRNLLARTKPSEQVAAGITEPWRLAMRSPVLADPFRWYLFLETSEQYFVREVDFRGRTIWTWERGPRSLDDRRVVEAMRSPKADSWRYFARLPFARIVEHEDGGATVTLSDARYHFAQGPYWCSVEVELPPAAAR